MHTYSYIKLPRVFATVARACAPPATRTGIRLKPNQERKSTHPRSFG